MKQTATNYLIDQLSLKAMAEHIPWVAEILDKAIEMEKEQIIEISLYHKGQGIERECIESYIQANYGIED
jgi:hypothetical protein